MTSPDVSSPELVLAMLADARFPTGSHTQSAGLEAAVQAGLTIQEIPAFAAARLSSVVATEAGTAVVARRLCVDGLATGAAREDLALVLTSVESAWAARTPSPALRDAARRLGRGYARLAVRLWPDSPATGAMALLASPSRAVVLGCVAAAAGLSAAQTARLCGYEDVQTIASAALKLLPMDPVDATRWVLDLHPAIEALVDRVAEVRETAGIPASGAPLIEQEAERHARARSRLFSV
jgi:urease accessory protein